LSLKHQADTQHRKLNTSPSTVDDKEVLKKPLCDPMVRKVDLHFPLGLEVTARNLKGVTIKDALDAIHKQFRKKVCTLHSHSQHVLCHVSTPDGYHCNPHETNTSSPQADDELELPYLAGFEWDKEECYTRFIVHQKATGAPSSSKSKKKKGGEE
jgi:hypothetical protein